MDPWVSWPQCPYPYPSLLLYYNKISIQLDFIRPHFPNNFTKSILYPFLHLDISLGLVKVLCSLRRPRSALLPLHTPFLSSLCFPSLPCSVCAGFFPATIFWTSRVSQRSPPLTSVALRVKYHLHLLLCWPLWSTHGSDHSAIEPGFH